MIARERRAGSAPVTLWMGVMLGAWAALLLLGLGTTLHTVDNIRDYRVALAIARGEASTWVSQPFAGWLQLPALYFHVLALPLRWVAHETAVFAFVGVCALLSVSALAAAIRQRFGGLAACSYLAFALPVHAVIIFPGVSNPALAFAGANLFLAAWLAIERHPGWAPTAMLVSAAVAVTMHPSAFAFAGPALAAAVVLQRPVRRSKAFWAAGLSLAVLLLVWAQAHGFRAPEAASSGRSLGLESVIGRLASPSQWFALWSTPWAHLHALPDLVGLVGKPVITGVAVLSSLCAVAGVGVLLRQRDRFAWAFLFSIGGMLVVSTALLDAWGFWYLDALWPPFALLAGLGGARTIQAVAKGHWLALPVLLMLTLTLPTALKWVVMTEEQYRVETRGFFLPRAHSAARIDIPVASALFRYRDFVASSGGCDSRRFVGLDEAWLRDLTLRLAFSGCARSSAAASGADVAHPRFTVREVASAQQPSARAALMTFAGYRVDELPRARVVITPPGGTNEILSWRQGARYSYYLPAGLVAGTRIEVLPDTEARMARSVDPSSTPILMLLFRCTDTALADLERALSLASASATPFAFRAKRALPPISYSLISAPIRQSPGTFVTLAQALPGCDLSAWVE